MALVPATEKKGKQRDRGAARRRKQAARKLSTEENITIDTKGAAMERELVKEQITGVDSAIIEKIDKTEGDAPASQIITQKSEKSVLDLARTEDSVSTALLKSNVMPDVASLRASSSTPQPPMQDHEIVQTGRLLLQLWSASNQGCVEYLEHYSRVAHRFNQEAFHHPNAYPTEEEAREAYGRLLRGQRMSSDEIAAMPGEVPDSSEASYDAGQDATVDNGVDDYGWDNGMSD